MKIQKIDGLEFRADTGPLQIGTDWPGTFFRGDDSAFMAMSISSKAKKVATETEDPEVISLCLMMAIQAERLIECCLHKDSKDAVMQDVMVIRARGESLNVLAF